jgi:hypothetical protein
MSLSKILIKADESGCWQLPLTVPKTLYTAFVDVDVTSIIVVRFYFCGMNFL